METELIRKEIQRGSEEARTGIRRIHGKWGLRTGPFEDFPSTDMFQNRDEEMRLLSRAIGRGLGRGRSRVACIGPYGSGKTTLLRLLEVRLSSAEIGLRTAYHSASTFRQILTNDEEDDIGETVFDVLMSEISYDELDVHLIDDVETLGETFRPYEDQIDEWIEATQASTIVVMAFATAGWLRLEAESQKWFTDEVWVSELSEDSIAAFLEKLLERVREPTWKGDRLTPFSTRLIASIARVSRGLPGVALELARIHLGECVRRSSNRITTDMSDRLIDRTGIDECYDTAVEAFREGGTLAGLLHLLLLHPGGISATRAASLEEVTRTSMIYHLRNLEKRRCLTRRRRGREVLYLFPSYLRSVVEMALSLIEGGVRN